MIKKIILLILLPYFSISGLFGQTLTAKDLISRFQCNSFECFNDYVITKGFSLSGSVDTGNLKIYFYSSEKEYTTGKNNDIVTPNVLNFILSRTRGYKSVGLAITSKSNYASLQAAFKNLGFVKAKSYKPTDSYAIGGMATSYKSSKFPNCTLNIYITIREKGGDTWVEYRFQIESII